MYGELGKSAAESRRRSRHQKHRAGREGDHAQEHRSQPRRRESQPLVGCRLPRADRDADLEIGKGDGRERQRQQIVDATVRDQGGCHAFGGSAASKGPEHDNFENAGPCGNVRDRRERGRCGEDGGEGEKVDRGCRKKYPESGRSPGQANRRQRQLSGQKTSAGGGKRNAPKAHRSGRAERKQAGDARQSKARHRSYQRWRPPEKRAGRPRLDETGQAANARQSDGEAADDEHKQAGDIIGLDAGGAVNPIADRRCGQDTEADRVAERAAAEPGDKHGGRRRAGANVAHCARISGDKRGETHRGRGDRQKIAEAGKCLRTRTVCR